MTTDLAPSASEIRTAIQQDPSLVLQDAETLQSLLVAHKQASNSNVINFQGVIIEQLRKQLSLSEEDHRTLLEIAMGNMHALDQVHAACVAMLEANSGDSFIDVIHTRLPSLLDVTYATLIMERHAHPPLLKDVLTVPPGALKRYFQLGSNQPGCEPREKIVLRATPPQAQTLYACPTNAYKSEALTMLDTGTHGTAAMLVFADHDPEKFTAKQSTDLLAFMGRIAELIVQKWQIYS